MLLEFALATFLTFILFSFKLKKKMNTQKAENKMQFSLEMDAR
jgi:hypothetical protein